MHRLEDLESGRLAGSSHLKLACGLTEFPRAILDLAETLEILDLSGNALSALPDELWRLKKLRIIFCSDNRFTALPEVLGACNELEMIGFKANRIATVSPDALPPKLRWLILTDNQLPSLPGAIGHCQRLQKLMLAGNQLRELPPELANCQHLELTRLSANRLTRFPECLLELPRLAWLAYAGNPFSEDWQTAQPLPTTIRDYPWSSLHIHETIGEGTSGIICRASELDDASQNELAVKLFKNTMTSDGLPLAEMNACLQAAGHPNLIPVLGRITQHPKATPGLVMRRIAPTFQALGGPPDLNTCTRDTYPPDRRFTHRQACEIARGIASATRHLHQRGILHGDLYAHNILHDEHGNAHLGDFGAASPLPPSDHPLRKALEAIEYRAHACLLEELGERCTPTPAEILLTSAVMCRENPHKFSEITASLVE